MVSPKDLKGVGGLLFNVLGTHTALQVPSARSPSAEVWSQVKYVFYPLHMGLLVLQILVWPVELVPKLSFRGVGQGMDIQL